MSAAEAVGGPLSPPFSRKFLALAVGSAGVVYGDIGTSPLYAFKESVAHFSRAGRAASATEVLGVVSLMFWALMVIVTLKYVLVLMRFDNRGEGGTLSLMALVQRAGGRGAAAVTLIGMVGAGLFFGDAMLTPAISVLSAVEGLSVAHGVEGRLDPYILPIALAVLVALFVAQRRGTGGIGRFFGPVCLVWFAVLAILGAVSILRAPEVLQALDPLRGLALLAAHPALAPAVLGSVFLTVTGAEALYADMGHFGAGPIRAAWLAVVFPCLTVNYLGQGALVLVSPEAAANPFFLMAPEWFQLPLVGLATAATVIASQAVISGAFSLTQQAIQLGLLPRTALRSTSEEHAGQIYAPQTNWILMAGVAALVLHFRSSTAMADAYGVAVVGAMITSSILAAVAVHRLHHRPIWLASLLFSPFLLVEAAFMSANLMKVAHGGYVPLMVAGGVILVMASWMRGAAKLARSDRSDVTMTDLIAMLRDRPPLRTKGTAVFLNSDPDAAPAALLHNLKHNHVLHSQVILLHIRMLPRPRVSDAERVEVAELAPGFKSVVLSFGFMETPNVARGLTLARGRGLKFDIMSTSFFLSHRSVLPRRTRGFARLQDLIFVFLARNAERAADYFQLPPSRVVELGAQVAF